MSTNRVVEELSDSASFALSSLSSFRFAVEGGSSSNFTVTDTRKCSKTCKFSSSPKRRDSELPLPLRTKPKVRSGAAAVQAAYDWEPNSNQTELADTTTSGPLFEICSWKEEAITETDGHGPTTPISNASVQSSTTSPQPLLRGFRQDLDEEVQIRTIEEYRKGRHAAWVKLHPTANSKYSEVSKWPKRQQAMGLALLVVEASIHMRKLRAVHRTPVTPLEVIQSLRTRAQPPATSQTKTTTLDITIPRNVAMVLHDVFILVDNNQEGQDKYEAVRAQLHGLRMWHQ